MKGEIELSGLRGVDLDERLCHELLPVLRKLELRGKFWCIERDGTWLWQCNWFHPDGSIARLCTPKYSRAHAFIFACAELRAGGLEFAKGDLELPEPPNARALLVP